MPTITSDFQKKAKKIEKLSKNVDIIREVCYSTYALRKKGLTEPKKSAKKLKKLLTKFRVDVIVYLRDAKEGNAKRNVL